MPCAPACPPGNEVPKAAIERVAGPASSSASLVPRTKRAVRRAPFALHHQNAPQGRRPCRRLQPVPVAHTSAHERSAPAVHYRCRARRREPLPPHTPQPAPPCAFRGTLKKGPLQAQERDPFAELLRERNGLRGQPPASRHYPGPPPPCATAAVRKRSMEGTAENARCRPPRFPRQAVRGASPPQNGPRIRIAGRRSRGLPDVRRRWRPPAGSSRDDGGDGEPPVQPGPVAEVFSSCSSTTLAASSKRRPTL